MTVVAVDIGGTWTRVADVARFPTDPDYDRELAMIVDAAASTNPTAAGVSFGGRVTSDGTVRVSLNLRGYEGRALGADLAAALGCPVRVAHDATCGLLGEAFAPGGALHGVERCGYLTLSTGVGAAVRLGSTVLTTEAGHQLVAGNDLPCACGQTGCLETLVGGRALAERLGRPLDTVDDPGFWQVYSERLAPGLVNLALTAGLSVIALGGAVALRGDDLWRPLWSEVARLSRYNTVEVRKAGLGGGAPLAGAAVLADGPAPLEVLH
ncbi:ROK family protein [Dactylosporangium sp. AC04546]|uniref:ROK family protein n=1 Tax=Dactylosporangium sp. AC04546 TaxID=2862460 RepID=UPI001EE11995|nr:ROK family protein [Dactylosporangium sp. AC04546]WVK87515.1 ROK family protein [Dactylosporangium sp. AC04546]